MYPVLDLDLYKFEYKCFTSNSRFQKHIFNGHQLNLTCS